MSGLNDDLPAGASLRGDPDGGRRLHIVGSAKFTDSQWEHVLQKMGLNGETGPRLLGFRLEIEVADTSGACA